MVAEDCSSSSSPMITAARASILLARFMRCFIFPRYPKSTEILRSAQPVRQYKDNLLLHHPEDDRDGGLAKPSPTNMTNVRFRCPADTGCRRAAHLFDQPVITTAGQELRVEHPTHCREFERGVAVII